MMDMGQVAIVQRFTFAAGAAVGAITVGAIEVLRLTISHSLTR